MFGIYTRLRKYSKKIKDNSLAKFFKNKSRRKKFVFNGQRYNYFIHPYNYTWRNERCVEIPIIDKILTGYKGRDILEVGNVMSHYFKTSHDVVDKYEKEVNVINKDIVEFKTSKKYDLIICISTLEHVGWDEDGNYRKVLKAIANLKKLLKKRGRIIITHPLGYNFYMDEFIRRGTIKFDRIFLMERINLENEWRQIKWKKQILRYGYPYEYANGLIIGEIYK